MNIICQSVDEEIKAEIISEDNYKILSELLGLDGLDNLISTISISCINKIILEYGIDILVQLYDINCNNANNIKKLC